MASNAADDDLDLEVGGAQREKVIIDKSQAIFWYLLAVVGTMALWGLNDHYTRDLTIGIQMLVYVGIIAGLGLVHLFCTRMIIRCLRWRDPNWQRGAEVAAIVEVEPLISLSSLSSGSSNSKKSKKGVYATKKNSEQTKLASNSSSSSRPIITTTTTTTSL